MCDSILAPPQSAARHWMLFGKNSDRQRNEAQTVEFFAAADHARDATLHCTYLTIPQIEHTCAVLLCRPFWIWGAEMGANEHGVVIGNEGLHARSAAPEEPALTGMDLVRLALERSQSAAAALDVITGLLEKYGQGGNCGHLAPNYYNNGFLIADAGQAFVLETVGREWLCERVRSVRSMSNIYSVGAEAVRVSRGLPALICNSGWADEATREYATVITHPHREHIGQAGARRARSTSLLRSREREIDVADMMRILRDHGDTETPSSNWHPDGAPKISVCMHAGAEGRMGQTTGSLVSEIAPDCAVHWVTGTAAPCISIFKPVFGGQPPPPHGEHPTDSFSAATLWWRHEQLHRAAIEGDFGKFLEEIREERDALEASFRVQVDAVRGATWADQQRVAEGCWEAARWTEERWFARLRKPASPRTPSYLEAWHQSNQLAGVEP